MPAWSIANRRLRPRSPSSARSFVAAKTFTPRRFESRKTGKSGYQPACANEWVRGLCEKPRVKCAECPSRRFLPVTDTAATDERTACCRKAAITCCGSWLKMSAITSMQCSMRSCERCRTDGGSNRGKGISNEGAGPLWRQDTLPQEPAVEFGVPHGV